MSSGREHPGLENCPLSGVGALPIRASAPQCSSYEEEGAGNTCKKVSPHAMSQNSWRNSPRTPLHSGPFWDPPMRRFWEWGNKCTGGSMCLPQWTPPTSDKRNTWWSYIWNCASVCLGLVSRAHQCQLDPPPWQESLSWSLASWTQSPSARPRGAEMAKQLREDSSTRQSRSWTNVPILNTGALSTRVSCGSIRVPCH